MIHKVVLSGYAYQSVYAENVSELMAKIRSGDLIKGVAYFDRDEEAISFKLQMNPHYVPFVHVKKQDKRTLSQSFIIKNLQSVIAQTFEKAGLSTDALQGKNVRVYIPGNGARANLTDFAGYQDRNDEDDLIFFPHIKSLSAGAYGQDVLSHQLAKLYQLSWPPTVLYSASSSGMTTLHLAQNVINHGNADLVLVVGWLDITMQDILFLGGQNMLSDGNVQPFAENLNGVLPTNAFTAILLESESHLQQRGKKANIVLHSSVCYQSSGDKGGNTFSADFRAIAETLEASLEKAQLTPDDIGCIFPHGNGINSGDKAESMAIRKIWDDNTIPVVSYKGQIGYSSTCSSLVDIMIASETLQDQTLLAFSSQHPLDASMKLNLYANQPPLKFVKKHIIKSSLGLEGSVFSCIISLAESQELV